MSKYKFLLFLVFVTFVIPINLLAQGTGNNPYSRIGLGDLMYLNGNVRNLGMGNAGVGYKGHYFINSLNPALLPNLKNKYIDSTVKINLSVTPQFRSLTSASSEESSSGVAISYLTFSVPLSKRWTSAVGIQPYSLTDYNLQYNDTITLDDVVPVSYDFKAKGGIYKFNISNGWSLNSNLALGLDASYITGNIQNVSAATIGTSDTLRGFRQDKSYRSLMLKPGLYGRYYFKGKATRDTSGKVISRKNGWLLSFGATAEFYGYFKESKDIGLYAINGLNKFIIDTTVSSTSRQFAMPPTYKFGMAVEKGMFVWAIDYWMCDWSTVKDEIDPNYRKSWGVNTGIELTPGDAVNLRRRSYRLGFSYTQTPWVSQNIAIDDMSLSIGLTQPFGNRSSKRAMMPILPRVSIAVVAGKRGATTNGLLEEKYLKLHLGILLNDKWFDKRRID